MITVNSISGGKTSAYMAIHFPAQVNIFACVCIDYPKAAPKDKTVLNYCLEKLNGNFIASAESIKTLRAVMEIEQIIGKNIVWVRGESFDTVIDKAGCLPTWARRFCTTEMKIIPMFEYMYFRYGVTNTNIGFRADEFERVYEIKKGQKPKRKKESKIKFPVSCNNFGEGRQNWIVEVWQQKQYPLFDNGIYHLEIINFWKDHYSNIDFPLDSNCRGCHHKSPTRIKQNNLVDPEIMEWFAIQEKKKAPYTWHDDLIPYEKKFKMNFTEEIEFDSPMCNSGGCTD